MPYKNKEDKKEHNQSYIALRSEGYSLRDTYEPKKCPICDKVFKPQSRVHRFDKSQCRQKAWQRSQKNAH